MSIALVKPLAFYLLLKVKKVRMRQTLDASRFSINDLPALALHSAILLLATTFGASPAAASAGQSGLTI
jgi:hypothetical protein